MPRKSGILSHEVLTEYPDSLLRQTKTTPGTQPFQIHLLTHYCNTVIICFLVVSLGCSSDPNTVEVETEPDEPWYISVPGAYRPSAINGQAPADSILVYEGVVDPGSDPTCPACTYVRLYQSDLYLNIDYYRITTGSTLTYWGYTNNILFPTPLSGYYTPGASTWEYSKPWEFMNENEIAIEQVDPEDAFLFVVQEGGTVLQTNESRGESILWVKK